MAWAQAIFEPKFSLWITLHFLSIVILHLSVYEVEQSVPKRRHINFRRRGITQKKAYNIQNTAKVWSQEMHNSSIYVGSP